MKLSLKINDGLALLLSPGTIFRWIARLTAKINTRRQKIEVIIVFTNRSMISC